MIDVRSAVIAAYRDHLSRRYTPQNVHRFEILADFPSQRIDEVRDFFLARMYPEADRRLKLDLAFDKLGSVLKSPRKMMPLAGTAISSVFKLGTLIPAALRAGLATFEGYIEIQRLESIMIKEAESRGIEDLSDEKAFAGIIAKIPDRDVQRFRRELTRLFKSLANIPLLETTLEIMGNSIRIISARPDVYTQEELEGIQIGYELLAGGLELFRSLSPEETQLVLVGVDRIEMDWIERMRAQASVA